VSEELPRPKRRVRYSGKYPRRFEEKYKELNPNKYADTVDKVLASGKTPAGSHRPICVAEILDVLKPASGEIALDATLGYGGHAREILERIRPGGRLIGLDVDPIELPKTETRLREAGFGADVFTAIHSNFAGIAKVLAQQNIPGVDLVVADLGVSSMQFDRPERGFSYKHDGPLDMRLNPEKGERAAALLAKISEQKLTQILIENADEPRAAEIAKLLANRRGSFQRTSDLTRALRESLRGSKEDVETSVRRVFQALRIAVNDEFAALDHFLRVLPNCLNPGGRAAILTFHSGEDRRVKNALKQGRAVGVYSDHSEEVIRPTREEIHSNPRAASAKLRWARRAPHPNPEFAAR
jgi:16S rRNA (cytosine1402-N4)-methyltransferase